MNSSITITFNSIPNFEAVFAFTDSLTGINLTQTFEVDRNNSGETQVNPFSLEGSANNYSNSLNLDYNITNLYTITVTSVVGGNYDVKLLANNPQSQFTLGENTTLGDISAVISNEPFSNFAINSVSISEANSTPCDTVEITVNTQEIATDITLPISQSVNTNPFVFNYNRSLSSFKIRMNNSSIEDEVSILVPKLLSADFNLNILNTPSSGSLQVQRINGQGLLTFEYSLNNTDWQTNNNFTQLPEDSYTLYIRDNIGCSISIPFEITSFTPSILDYDAIAEVSNLNPFAFKCVQEWSNCGIQKNNQNTLSFEEESIINQRNFTQKFQFCDTITTQIKTNYENITANIIDCNNNETELTVNKRTEFLNITDVRDSIAFQILLSDTYNTYLGLRFGSGNTYDPVTLQQNGSYVLDIPSWIDIGEYINLEGYGWYQVLNKISLPQYDETIIVLNEQIANTTIQLSGETLKASTLHNILDYERYEFNVDFSTFTEGYYKVKIDLQDDNFGTKQFLSEWIDLREFHKKCYVIDYYNSENNEINFATGFRGRLRIPYILNLKYKPNEEQDIYVTDNNTILLDSSVREFYDFSYKPQPTIMAKKLALVNNQDRLFYNDLNYLKTGEIDSSPLGSTNEHLIKGTLVKANYVFSLTEFVSGSEVLISTGTPLSVNSSGGGLLFVE